MTGISSFNCSDPFWTRNTKYQVPGFRIVTHLTRIVARTWEWLGAVTRRWRSPPEELSDRILQQKTFRKFSENFQKNIQAEPCNRKLSARILQQKRAKIFLPNNVQKRENVLESVSTNTEYDVEAFEGDKVGDFADFQFFFRTFWGLLVHKTLLTNTEDNVETFESDQIGDGDASLVLQLLRFCLKVKVNYASENEDDI